jgi:fibro-slime domain-containing protein
MRKKFKKRLLGIILTILMVVSVIPVQQVQPVKAADTQIIYLEISGGVTGWTKPGVHALDANDMIVNNLFAMDKVAGSDNIYKANIAANATKVIFTPNNTWEKGETDTVSIADANADLTTTYPCYKVTSYQSGSKKCWKGTWATYSASGEVDLTERFYVSTNLVDYINDARFDPGNKTRGYSNNNQGTVVDGSEKGANVYSYLDAAISGSPWYNSSGQDSKECQYTYPLYFGNMFDTKNRYGRMLNGSWYGLNNFSVGANVALEETGTTTGSSFYGAAAQGLVGKKLVNGKMVDPNNENVVLPYFSGEEIHPYNTDREIDKNKNLSEYYNNLQFPFKQTMDKNGVITYSYDSGSDYAVYYDFDNNSFYESNQYIQNGTTNDSTAPTKGFYPLNKPGDSREAVNMGFGTEFTIPFTLSKDGKINGQDITFNFTGDDDVWVFIDDYLVLDMGGAHRMASGTIDFAKKNVTVERAFTPDKSTTAAWKDGATRANQTSTESLKTFADIETDNGKTFADIMADDSKVHTLKMFYMERGMIDSNMSVSFNFSPIPSGLTLSKDVNTASVNDGLKSVVETKDNFDFTVTDTDTRTEYTYEKDYDGTRTEKKTTTNGVVEGLADNVYAKNFAYKDADSDGNKGLKIGTDFTITETENPNYDTRWFVTDISTGKTIDKKEGRTSKFTLGNASSGLTKVNYNVNFVNTPKVGTVNITKAWNGTVPETLKEEAFPFKVEVDLDGAAKKDEYSTYALKYTVDGNEFYTDADGNFKLKCDQIAAFEGIPTGATVKVTETKTTDDKSWVVSGSYVAESKPVEEKSNETLKITNATKTKTLNKVIYVETGKDTKYKPAEVETGYTVSKVSDGLTYSDNNGFKGEEPNKSYTANYTGYNSDGAIVNGTITVLTYQATNKVYVFDYGLESNIAEPNANGDGLFQGGKFYNEEAKGDMATSAKLGTITPAKENTQTTISSGSNIAIDSVGKADGAVTFKPIAFMDKVENYKYTANIAKVSTELDDTNPETGTTVHGTIKTMPANVVYYEDNFNATNENDDSSVKIVYTNSGSKPTNDPTYSQSNDQSENYGHDKAYNGDLEESGNSATEMNNGDGAYFTFTGDGFDIVSRTNENTAGLIAYVYNGKKDAEYFRNPEVFKAGTKDLVKSIPVDTFYSNGDLYQVPVISTTLQQRGTYTVYLKALKTYTGQSVIYIDGVRIYNPLADKSAYLETEKNTKVQELRGMLLGSSPSINLVTPDGNNGFLIDGGSTAVEQYLPEKPEIGAYLGAETLADVMKAGPNNELYLPIDNGVAFKVSTPVGDADWTLQVGAKSVSADTSTESDAVVADKAFTVYVKPDDVKETKYQEVKNYTINTSTDMYYDIDLKEVIKAQGWTADSYDVIVLNTTVDYNNYDIISLTNIKCAADMTLSKPSQLTRMGYNLAGRNVLTGNDEAVLSAKFGVTNVTRGKYASMTVVTKKEATDVQVTDPTGAVVTSFTKKTSSIDADGNKEWKLTFKVIKQRGEAKYSVDAVVNGSLTNMPYSTSIMVR